MRVSRPKRQTRRIPQRSRLQQSNQADDSSLNSNAQSGELSSDLQVNERMFQEVFAQCSDIVFRPIRIEGRVRMLVIYVDGLVDTKNLDLTFLKPVLYEGIPQGLAATEWYGSLIENQLVAVAQTSTVRQSLEVCNKVLNANVALLIDGEAQALILEVKGYSQRSIGEPTEEQVIRGPRDGFTEDLRVNTSLLRRKIRSPKLKFESYILGESTQTNVLISYLDGVVDKEMLTEVRERVTRIQTDAILDSGFIEEFIEDAPFSPFPTVQNTERPDVVAANLLEGKVAIFSDGSPFVLLAPFVLIGAFQSAEDYYERFIYTTAIRWLRFVLVGTSLVLPSAYVALTTFHPQMIPTNLVLTFAAAREASPFPTLIETLLMEIVFEALREAGIRLPKAVGSAVSIVGALVIGQAAVEAGIVSAPVVIVVAATGIASFAIPRYSVATAFRLLRFPMLFLAGTLGFFGITMGLLTMLTHLVNLRSFGIPYFTPIAPTNTEGLRDALWRAPRWRLHWRPASFVKTRQRRTPAGQRPSARRGKSGTK